MVISSRFTSRKFLLALVAGVVAFGNGLEWFRLTPEQVWQVVTPLLAFIGVEGLKDTVEAKKN